VPRSSKRPGVCYAATDEGLEFPVVDVTHPAFACDPTPAELDALADATFRAFEKWERLPAPLRWWLSRRSVILPLMGSARGGFVSGTATYLFKLGPENLGAYATRIDRHLNAGLSPVAVRLRLRAMVRQLADALAARLAASDDPVSLLNIGGGTAIDSLNALIALRRDRPALLMGRPVSVHVLDCDEAGPHFGARALAALLSEGAPLDGLTVTLQHVPYDWSHAATLREVLAGFDRASIAGCSSEGGLFEYGCDEDIVSNLQVLHDCGPTDLVVVGSVLRDGPTPARMRANAGMPSWRPFTLPALGALVAPAGWRIVQANEDNPLYATFTLGKS
jgi:hypothetical protein